MFSSLSFQPVNLDDDVTWNYGGILYKNFQITQEPFVGLKFGTFCDRLNLNAESTTSIQYISKLAAIMVYE